MTSKMEKVACFVVYALCFLSYTSTIPWHASCKIEWNFSADCPSVKNRLVGVINHWQGRANCQQGGERCLYKLISQSDTEIKATHTTPVKGYIDDLIFTFNSKQDGGCTVQGESHSEVWYAVLDYGTNYCNLHNLILGADLDKDPEFKESTSDSVCTQYSSADCDKY